MRIRHEHAGDEILILHRDAGPPFAAAMLGAIGRKRCAFDIAAMRHRDDHILALNQVLIVHVGAAESELRPARHGELFFHLGQLAANDIEHARTRPQNVEIVGDLLRQALGFIADFIAAKSCESRQLQGQDGAGLLVGQEDGIFPFPTRPTVGDQVEQRPHIHDRPGFLQQPLTCGVRVWRMTDDRDDLVNIGHGQRETDQDVGDLSDI